jgi:hypothetical protein
MADHHHDKNSESNTEYWRRYNRGFFNARPGYRPYWNKWRYYHNPGPYFYNTIYPMKYNIYEYDGEMSAATSLQNTLNAIFLEFGGKCSNMDILTMQKLKDKMVAFDQMLAANLSPVN